MKVLVLGKGFISTELCKSLQTDDIIYQYGYELNSINEISRVLDKYKPDLIINCIGKTGRPNIDWCETHKYETYFSNTIIPLLLAEVCNSKKIHLIHISSGCLYTSYKENNQGYKEEDSTSPGSYYSFTKLATDLVLKDLENVTILRIRMPLLPKKHPRNYIDKIINYKKLINEPNSMTYVPDLTKIVQSFIKEPRSGIFNATNPGILGAADIVREFQKFVPSHSFEEISNEDLNKMVLGKRSNCIIDSTKLYSILDFELLNIQENINDIIKKWINS